MTDPDPRLAVIDRLVASGHELDGPALLAELDAVDPARHLRNVLQIADDSTTRDAIAHALWEVAHTGWPWFSFQPDADAVLDALRILPEP